MDKGLGKLSSLTLTKREGSGNRKESALTHLVSVSEITDEMEGFISDLNEAVVDIKSLTENLEVMQAVAQSQEFGDIVDAAVDPKIEGKERKEIVQAICKNINTRARESQNLATYMQKITDKFNGAEVVDPEVEEEDETEDQE